MCASDFHHTRKGARLCLDGIPQFAYRRDQDFGHAGSCGNVHRGRKRIVRRLRHIHVIVGVNGLFASHHATRYFDGAIRDHFIGIHVRLGAAAGLPHVKRKMLVEFAGNHFIRGLHDQPSLICGKLSEVPIYERGSLFKDSKRANELGGHGFAPNIEMD